MKYNTIENSMVDRGVDDSVAALVSFMLRNQAVEAEMGNTKVIAKPTKGTPQGSVLSPIVFNMTVDNLLNQLENTAVYAQTYADDIALLARGHDLGF